MEAKQIGKEKDNIKLATSVHKKSCRREKKSNIHIDTKRKQLLETIARVKVSDNIVFQCFALGTGNAVARVIKLRRSH